MTLNRTPSFVTFIHLASLVTINLTFCCGIWNEAFSFGSGGRVVVVEVELLVLLVEIEVLLEVDMLVELEVEDVLIELDVLEEVEDVLID